MMAGRMNIGGRGRSVRSRGGLRGGLVRGGGVCGRGQQERDGTGAGEGNSSGGREDTDTSGDEGEVNTGGGRGSGRGRSVRCRGFVRRGGVCERDQEERDGAGGEGNSGGGRGDTNGTGGGKGNSGGEGQVNTGCGRGSSRWFRGGFLCRKGGCETDQEQRDVAGGEENRGGGQEERDVAGGRGFVGGRGSVGVRGSGGRGEVNGASGEGTSVSTRRSRKCTLRDEDNSACAQWDDDGRQTLPIAVDGDPRSHRMHGYSPGGFGTYPATPVPVRIAGNLIDCPKALRNLLAITRTFWPDGCVGMKDIDRKSPGFWQRCIDEFLRYYTWDPKYSCEEEARASIRHHMRDNMRRTLSDDKRRAEKVIADMGGSYENHRPKYVKPGVWSKKSEYWVSDTFKKKSIAGKAARQKVKTPHTSGARSFDHQRRDYMETHNGSLDYTIVYKDCHTLKDKDRKDQWITNEAKDIIDRYVDICSKKGIDPKETNIHSWIDAVGGIHKNHIPGLPRIRPADVLGSESCSSRPRKGEGSSGLSQIQDDMFLRVVDETLTRARAHPEEYTLTPEEVRVLASNVAEGYNDLPQDHPLMKEIQNSIVWVSVEVLNNLYKRHEPGAAKGKAIITDDDDNHDNESDHSHTASEDDDISRPFNVVSKGGPVIKG